MDIINYAKIKKVETGLTQHKLDYDEQATFPISNLVTNGDFSNGYTGWTFLRSANVAVVNGFISWNPSENNNSTGIHKNIDTDWILNHKYYIAVDTNFNVITDFRIAEYDYDALTNGLSIYTNTKLDSGLQRISTIYRATRNPGRISFLMMAQQTTNICKIGNVIIIDLTKTFGENKEPTIEKMDEFLAKYPNKWFDGTVQWVTLKEIYENVADIENKSDLILDTLLPRKKFFTINHKGASGIFPENTIPAFEQAGMIGFDFIETDVQKTSDGVFVLIHDWNIDRTTDGTGGVASMTYDQLQLFNIDHGSNIEYFTGLKIPTLDEYLQICGKYGAIPVIEIKSSVADYPDIINVIARNGFKNKCFVLLQSINDIDTIRSMDAEQPLIFCTFYPLIESDLDFVAQLGGVMVAQNYENANETLLQYAHSHNIKYGVHTLDFNVYDYVSKGYDFMISNTQCLGVDVDSVESSITHDLYLDEYTEVSDLIGAGITYSADFDNLTANTYSVSNGVLKIHNSGTRGVIDLKLDTSKYDIGDVVSAEFKVKNHPYSEISGTIQYYAGTYLEISDLDGSTNKKTVALHPTTVISEWETVKISCPIPWAVRKLISEGTDKLLRLRIGVPAGSTALFEIKDVTVSIKRVNKFAKF